MELQRGSWDSAAYRELLGVLSQMAEEPYREFRVRIVHADVPILGVRQPALKKLAGQILQGGALSFLSLQKGGTFEEIMLHGYVLAKCPLAYDAKLAWILRFTQQMDNWSVCDDFVTALGPFIRENLGRFLPDILPLLQDENEWRVRFVLVVLLECYLGEEFLSRSLSLCRQVRREEYYIKMAQAWLISMAYVKNPQETMETIEYFAFDRFLTLKSISKVMDSFQVPEERKEALRGYRDRYKRREEGKHTQS